MFTWWAMTGSNRRPPACKAGPAPHQQCLYYMLMAVKSTFTAYSLAHELSGFTSVYHYFVPIPFPSYHVKGGAASPWYRPTGWTDVSELRGVAVQTVSRLANGSTKKPTRLTARKIIRALRDNIDSRVSERDFWDM